MEKLSAKRHPNWAREQHAKPARNVAVLYISIGPSTNVSDGLSHNCVSHKRPDMYLVLDNVSEERLYTNDTGIVLLVGFSPEPHHHKTHMALDEWLAFLVMNSSASTYPYSFALEP